MLNIYGAIVLVALLGHFLLESWAEFLNIKALKSSLPGEFEGVYKEEEYCKSQLYTKAQSKFGLLTASFDLLLLLAFWWVGGFNWLDVLVRQADYGAVASGLLYVGAIILAKTVIAMPFSIYSTFILEERFGFNKTTPKLFVMDFFKGLLLALLFGAPLLAGIFYLFEWAGSFAWFYCWLLVTAFSLCVQFIAPTWIMPLFNKFTPLEDGELKNEIMAYARSVSFPLDNVFVMDGSKRSTKANAFFTGFGKHKRIALFDTLIEKHSTAELVAILAHEIGHYKKKHILQGMVLSILNTGVMLFLLSIFCYHQGLFAAFGVEQQSLYVGFILFGLLFSPAETALSLLLNFISRKNEFEADCFAKTTVGSGEDLIAALKKLSVSNLSNLTPHPFYVWLHYSHPPLLQRINALRVS